MLPYIAHGGPGTLVGRFILDKPLTASQLRRLPEALKARLYCPGASVGFLEWLYGLEGPRDYPGELQPRKHASKMGRNRDTSRVGHRRRVRGGRG